MLQPRIVSHMYKNEAGEIKLTTIPSRDNTIFDTNFENIRSSYKIL